MSKYQIYECDRCRRKERTEVMPSYWAQIQIVLDDNFPGHNGQQFMFCNRCMDAVMRCMETAPEAV